ncbi:MAG: hypothetical protein HKN68_15795 [Saprospiraceae bacterium]|nr:hypothetical protein [Saprospiraceae bacterium]
MKSHSFSVLFILMICLFCSIGSSAQIKLGLGAGLISDGSTAFLQGRVEMGPRSFKMAGAFNLFLEAGADWAVDIDGHYKVADIGDDIFLDVFPGLNLLKANDDTDIGVNLGGTLRIETNRNAIFIEPKYTIGTYDSFVITGGFIF